MGNLKATRHLIYTHSPVTQLVADAIKLYDKLDPANIVVVHNRKRNKSHVFSADVTYHRVRKIYLAKQKHYLILDWQVFKFDRWIRRIVSDNRYRLYVPHLRDWHLKLMASHPLCDSVCYLEEGLLGYDPVGMDNFNKSLRLPDYLPTFYRRRFANRGPAVNVGYGLSARSFYWLPTHVDLLGQVKTMLAGKRYDFENVFILSPYITVLGAAPEVYYEEFRQVVDAIASVARPTSPVYYKFHPSDDESVRSRTTSIFDNYKGLFYQLTDDFGLEEALIARTLNVFSFNSSVDYYALTLGSRIFLLDGLMSCARFQAFEFYDSMMKPFKIASLDDLRNVKL